MSDPIPTSPASDDERFARVVGRFEPDSVLLRVWPQTGGVSAQTTVLEIERPDGRRERLMLRRHGAADLRRNADVAADEFRLLRYLRQRGLAVPAALHLDTSGDIFSTPYLVLDYVEGHTELAPGDPKRFIEPFAAHLATIHEVEPGNLPFVPRHAERVAASLRERPRVLDDSLEEGRIRALLESVWPIPQRNAAALLHGDYWPGNVLWRDGRVVAVIDWEDAAVGDPLADLANTRMELVWAWGLEAMHAFTHSYRTMTDLDWTALPYWDLCAALRPAGKLAAWAGDDAREAVMRAGHRQFVAQAFESLP